MGKKARAKKLNSEAIGAAGSKDSPGNPTRRQFLQRAAGAGIALAGSAATAWANTHPHPSPQSISYLDRRMYIRNMEVIAHILPGQDRGGKMQMMSGRETCSTSPTREIQKYTTSTASRAARCNWLTTAS